MKCPTCGNDNSDDARFCAGCGASMSTSTSDFVEGESAESSMVNFPTAVKLGFARYATFSGRSTRAEYWWWRLFISIAQIPLMVADGSLGTYSEQVGSGLLSGLFGLATAIPTLALAVRRLHDINKTGWWLLVSGVPGVGWIILTVWAIKRGDKGPNEYGPDPRQAAWGGTRIFSRRKVNPEEKAKALELLLLWDRLIDTVDHATDAMRLAAAEDPSGIQSERFEGNRLAAVAVVARLLEETKDQKYWPKFEDEKGFNLMTWFWEMLNETEAQQLDSLRLQREYVMALKGDQLAGGKGEALAICHQRIERAIISLETSAAALAKHYELRPHKFTHGNQTR